MADDLILKATKLFGEKYMDIHIVGAVRPNFMKVAPLYKHMQKDASLRPVLVHTGQHYDYLMSQTFFEDLDLPRPEVHLEVGSGTHSEQTGRVLIAYGKELELKRPDAVIVVGDVNSTLACALAAVKLQIRVIHLEAGLRSWDRTMPEEINRIVTDSVSDLLWTPSLDANANLINEGISEEKIDFVGNIMIDTLVMMQDKIRRSKITNTLNLVGTKYSLVTFHRPSNVDDKKTLKKLVEALIDSTRHTTIVFPIHPRTRSKLSQCGALGMLENNDKIILVDPLGYVDFLKLVTGASVVVTDSGGIQEETTFLGVPCLTMRKNTERPITISHGTNRLINACDLSKSLKYALDTGRSEPRPPPQWDGKTAGRCIKSLRRFLS